MGYILENFMFYNCIFWYLKDGIRLCNCSFVLYIYLWFFFSKYSNVLYYDKFIGLIMKKFFSIFLRILI